MAVIPPKVLNVNIQQITPVGFWNADDGMGDPWLGYPYQWEITCTVSPQFHSSHLTREAYVYHGLDIEVGDWVSDFITAAAVRIISIDVPNTNSEFLKCIVEDIDRYNTFTDPTGGGNGVCSGGQGIVFSLGNDGLPVFGGFSPYYAALANNLAFQNDIEARFRHRNILSDYITVHQTNHGFSIGDTIYMSSLGLYEKATGSDVSKIIGTVTDLSANIQIFSYRPVGKYVTDLEFPLPGSPGDVIYLDAYGDLTNIKPVSASKALYIRLNSPTAAIIIGQGDSSSNNTSSSTTGTIQYNVPLVSNNQTIFELPVGVFEVMNMSINGMENTNYTYDPVTRMLVFDPIETGYGIDSTDDVFFLCQSYI